MLVLGGSTWSACRSKSKAPASPEKPKVAPADPKEAPARPPAPRAARKARRQGPAAAPGSGAALPPPSKAWKPPASLRGQTIRRALRRLVARPKDNGRWADLLQLVEAQVMQLEATIGDIRYQKTANPLAMLQGPSHRFGTRIAARTGAPSAAPTKRVAPARYASGSWKSYFYGSALAIHGDFHARSYVRDSVVVVDGDLKVDSYVMGSIVIVSGKATLPDVRSSLIVAGQGLEGRSRQALLVSARCPSAPSRYRFRGGHRDSVLFCPNVPESTGGAQVRWIAPRGELQRRWLQLFTLRYRPDEELDSIGGKLALRRRAGQSNASDLLQQLSVDSAETRLAAVTALAEHGTHVDAIVRALLAREPKERDVRVRRQLMTTLGRLARKTRVDMVPTLVRVIKEDKDARTRQSAAMNLGYAARVPSSQKAAVAALRRVIDDPSAGIRVRISALAAVTSMTRPGFGMGRTAVSEASLKSLTPSLIKCLDEAMLRSAAMRLLGSPVHGAPAVSALIPYAKAGDAGAVAALGRHGKLARPALPVLLRLARDAGPARRAAVRALGSIGDPRAVNVLIRALRAPSGDSPSSLGELAATALGRIGPKAKAAVPALRKVAKTARSWRQIAAIRALPKITGESSGEVYKRYRSKRR